MFARFYQISKMNLIIIFGALNLHIILSYVGSFLLKYTLRHSNAQSCSIFILKAAKKFKLGAKIGTQLWKEYGVG